LNARHTKQIAAKITETWLKKTEVLLNPEKSSTGKHLRILDIEVDLSSGTVWRDGEVIDLPELSFRLLTTLATSAPRIVDKDELIASVWGSVVVSDETLMQRVRLLRQVLGDDSQSPRYIASVRGRGYRMVAPVEEVAPRNDSLRTHFFKSRYFAIGIVTLVLIAMIGLLLQRESADQTFGIRTLAVLPFDDLSAEGRFGHFADGMQEELLARLTAIDEVSVLSRTSVERFRGTNDSVPEISRLLNADGIIEGSVRVSDTRLRITVQLIDGDSDRHLWAETYDEALTVENVFAIQERVANSIAEAIRAQYRRQNSDALGLPTTNIEAYDLYLLGRYHTFRQTPQNLVLAVQYLRQATEIDPGFAQAYATLGWAYAFQGTGYGLSKPTEVIPLAREAALRALELDDQLADAHSLYADLLTWYDWQFELAEIEYRRVRTLDPHNVLGYALFLSSQSRHDEAIELLDQRLESTPNDDYVLINAGWNYLRAGQSKNAIDVASQVGDHPDANRLLGYAYLNEGDTTAALNAFEADLRQKARGQLQVGNLASIYFKIGRVAEAQALLDELESQAETKFVSSLMLAKIYFAKGDEDRGFALLEAAVEDRERGVIFLGAIDAFVEQKHDPRYSDILDRIGLQPENPTAQELVGSE
jgi:TolB-like protein/DNA-binding winged helix-turn-helix (wHTH) protein/Tfp pilus assembly protein PilF